MIKKIIILPVALVLILSARAADDALFPDVPGWKMKIDERVYHSGDLWELINGAADIFLSYYFEDLHIAEYVKKNQMIRVELYRHQSTEDTYGIYSAERMPDYPQVNIGSQGYKSQGVLNFFAGNYYVKIMSAGVDEADEQTIAMVADKVSAQLAQPAALPAALNLLPEEGRIKLSDTYIAQNFLGYSFFHHAFSAMYKTTSDFQLFVIQLNPEEIQKMVDAYIKLMKEDNVAQKDGIYVVSDQYNGTLYLKQRDSYLIGVMNTESEATARDYIGKTLANIK